uniref:Uncharacterized protein n=1 Tax=Tanacetum cinerariifolium TaxID=118510 RepID=A0A699H336_TANCI|nr:hypothetical protein [Tanacetum cinerariifolium]
MDRNNGVPPSYDSLNDDMVITAYFGDLNAFFGDHIAPIPTNHHIYNPNESAGPSHALVGASHSIVPANGSANMLVFGGGGGGIQQGMMIPAAAAGASPSIMKRKLTEAELRPQISKKQKDPSVEHNAQVWE